MRRLFITIFLSIAVISILRAQSAVEYTDSLTNVTLKLSEECSVIRHNGFHKATFSLKMSDIEVYSMKSEDGKQYSWEQVNSFDSKNKYGKLIKYQRAPGMLDGWVRYYTNKTTKGRDYISCVILIRGKDYAFYTTESAYMEESLLGHKILENASFPRAKIKTERPKILIWLAWLLECVFIFFSLIFFKIVKKMSDGTYCFFCIFTIVAAILWSSLFLNIGWESLIMGVVSVFCWVIVSDCDSRHRAIQIVNDMLGG